MAASSGAWAWCQISQRLRKAGLSTLRPEYSAGLRVASSRKFSATSTSPPGPNTAPSPSLRTSVGGCSKAPASFQHLRLGEVHFIEQQPVAAAHRDGQRTFLEAPAMVGGDMASHQFPGVGLAVQVEADHRLAGQVGRIKHRGGL